NQPGTTLFLALEDGSGIVVAAISDFIGSVTFDDGVAVDISYQPSANSAKWREYGLHRPQRRKAVEMLHAMAATAVRAGDFRIRPRDASAFADRIRVDKAVDPTLGVHASYAYSDAGRKTQSHDIWEILRDDIHLNIFDVALMAGELRGIKPSN